METSSVVSRPQIFLRVDGFLLFIASLLLFSSIRQSWWLVPLLLFVPDIFMVGYAKSTKVGALIYNTGHSYLLPTVTTMFGWYQHHHLVLAIGLIWLAHVGMDRFLGYGLKYDDNFKHTHLGNLSKK
jgi:hypothetical protein